MARTGARQFRTGHLMLGVLGMLGMLAPLPATAATVLVTLGLDPELRAGTDVAGNVRLFAPSPVDPGSSIAHWDPSAFPNLLLEPSNNADLPGGELDLTPALLRDIGWRTSGGATIELLFTDAANQGFNDPSLGQPRRTAIRAAADIWEGVLASSITIHVRVGFSSLACEEGSGVLAQAGPVYLFKLESGGPFRDTWYVGALAEAITGSNLSLDNDPNPRAADIRVTFNSRIDEGCLGSGTGYDYSPDGNAPPRRTSFVNVALHELAHGFGFLTLADLSTGALFMGAPDIYTQFTFDRTTGRRWAQMGPAELRASAVNGPHVVWNGAEVRAAANQVLSAGSPTVRVEQPEAIAGSYLVGTAEFGPSLADVEVTGELVVVNDGSPTPTLGCRPAVNRGALRGRVALIDRGDCRFDEKTTFAQQAGAIGVIVVNNQPGLLSMGGAGPTIPAVLVSRSDGELFKQALRGELEPPDEEPQPETEDPSVCEPGPTQLCLNDGRFRVELGWEAPSGDGGDAAAVPLTGDTGYFWFLSPSNVEVVVKVLDACADFDRFWVFAGGLTNLAVDLKVVDTRTGTVRRFENRQGEGFRPIQDTDAFRTCSAP